MPPAAASSDEDDEDDEDEEHEVPIYTNDRGNGAGYLFKDGTFIGTRVAKDVANHPEKAWRDMSAEHVAALVHLFAPKAAAATARAAKAGAARAGAAAPKKAAPKKTSGDALGFLFAK